MCLQPEAESLLEGSEFEVDSLTVLELVHLELVHKNDCSAYDCELVVLAVTLSTKLVSLDKKLLGAFPNLARTIPEG